VDWDDTRLAPKECDLMMGVGGLGGDIVGPREEAWFLRGYGPATIDPSRWPTIAISARSGYRRVRGAGLAQPTLGEASRRNAVQRTARAFAPGSIITLAHQLARVATCSPWPPRRPTCASGKRRSRTHVHSRALMARQPWGWSSRGH
jgi:hypothetical protein